MSETEAPGPLPTLPPRLGWATLRGMEAAALDAEAERLAAAERATRAAMAPWDRQIREIRARRGELDTERRRRERAERHTARLAVQEGARSGQLPSLADALLAEPSPLPDDRPLATLRSHLSSGGEVGLGYPSRPGVLGFTDGRQVASASTWGEARRLYARGWEPGAPGTPGVRVHLAGTRVERVITPSEVVVDLG